MKIQQERFVEHGRGARRMSGAQQGKATRRNTTQRNVMHRGAVLSSGSASKPSWNKDVAGLDMTGSEFPRGTASVPCSRRDCRDVVRSRSTRLLAPPRPDTHTSNAQPYQRRRHSKPPGWDFDCADRSSTFVPPSVPFGTGIRIVIQLPWPLRLGALHREM
jgi:hypothetical protein